MPHRRRPRNRRRHARPAYGRGPRAARGHRKKYTKAGRPGGSGAVYNFKRQAYEIVSLGTTQHGAGGWQVSDDGKSIAKVMEFTLAQLSDNTDFKNLFRYYRLNAIRVQVFCANTAVTDNAYAGQFPNGQFILRNDTNLSGLDTSTSGWNNPQSYMDSQTAKCQVLVKANGKPIDFLMKLRQSNMVYSQASGIPPSFTAYSLQKPKWVDTTSPLVTHHGQNVLIERLDNALLTAGFNNEMKLRFQYTYYLQCKKVS